LQFSLQAASPETFGYTLVRAQCKTLPTLLLDSVLILHSAILQQSEISFIVRDQLLKFQSLRECPKKICHS